jgi:allantoin racemase
MRILVINPVGTDRWDKKDEDYLKKFASKDTQIKVLSLKRGPASVESFVNTALVCREIIETVEGNKDKFDAIIINCLADPCIEASREIANIPVIGPGEISIHIACLLGHKFTIISPTKKTALQIELNVKKIGIESRLAAVIPLGIGVLDLEENPKNTIQAVVEKAQKSVNENGADVIILGCTGLAYWAEEIQKRLNVPVIEPASTTCAPMRKLHI